jgi:hypothetical protein
MDLHVWNSDGKHAGWRNGVGIENQIPGGLHHGDGGGASCLGGSNGGLEEYSDSAGNSHLITIGVCYAATSETGITPIPSFVLDVHHTDGSTHEYATPAIGWPPDVTIVPFLEEPGEALVFHSGLAGEYVPGAFCPSP